MKIGNKIIELPSIDSTNNYVAKEFMSGSLAEGTVILAAIQTAGKGQRGNKWHSTPYENLTFSFPLSLKSKLLTEPIAINFVTSIALCLLVRSHCDDAAIKWPNDIVVANRKIAGILIEKQYYSSNKVNAVVGIGLNINQKHFSVKNATSLFNETGCIYAPKEVLLQFIAQFNFWVTQPFEVLEEKYHELLWLKNKISQFKSIDGECFEGAIIQVNRDGKINIKTNQTERYFANGEIHFIERDQ
ncbi:MAG: biotin--[acetyl-CoA-carboxylase] ligase [Crocinitomicaceae bacterium]|nr:biotin--[acetyl-CoA-carboxylase] ligase [Crocinitomicaceae bacterium]